MAEETEILQQLEGDFETMSVSNGASSHWLGSALRAWLDVSPQAFDKAVGRAMTVCTTLSLKVHEHFPSFQGEDGQSDWKMTRFACYLVAMNCSPRNPIVAQAQAYFASIAEQVAAVMENVESVERVHMRQEVVEASASLSGVAKSRDVENYGRFLNAGYMGLYNMGVAQLRAIKGVPNGSVRSPLDFMGKRELAANFFRLTETEGRICKDEQIRGQARLEETAREVGRGVRELMDVLPEVLAYEVPHDIKKVQQDLKKTQRGMQRLDMPEKTTGGKKKKKAAGTEE